MIGLDVPVVVRYIVQDDPRQSALATRLFERTLTPEDPGFITLVALLQIAWVLTGAYGVDRATIRKVVEGLLGTREIVVEDAEIVWKALRAWERSDGEFTDALIGQLLAARGCERTVTFDKVLARLPGFELLA
jgi:predicted nucleic-acid-binding protein